jgi:hypothetical protein
MQIWIQLMIFKFVVGFKPQSPLRYKKPFVSMELFKGNPIGKFIWDQVWKLPIMKLGTPGSSPTTFGDNANVLKGNILQLYGNQPSIDGAPVAVGEVGGFLEGTAFLGLQKYAQQVSFTSWFFNSIL